MPINAVDEAKLRAEAHPALIDLFLTAAQEMWIRIFDVHRGKEEQDAAYRSGRSQLPFPKGKHNGFPSLAVDGGIGPIEFPDYPKTPPEGADRAAWLEWRSKFLKAHRADCRWFYYGGYMCGLAKGKGIPVRWGRDWDGDEDFWDNKLDDSPHIEYTGR